MRHTYSANVILLDGPMGTELAFRDVPTSLPRWSAGALVSHPEIVTAIHQDYVDAGADVLTTNTFRTAEVTLGAEWRHYTHRAVSLARHAAGASCRVAGSIAPLADCYRPDLSPASAHPDETFQAHSQMAEALADECDLILCETFPSIEEAVLAARAAVATGRETWVALTAGPEEPLLSTDEMREGAKRLVDEGVSALLVSCSPAAQCRRYVEALAAVGLPAGVYANAGVADIESGFRSDPKSSPERYLRMAAEWADAGAVIIGGCCGTRPAHIKALNENR
ncbi:MAG: S-methylmethionine-dependent homocysteine/selenocysteine methylase [Polyangiales bacterium]